MRKSRPLQQCGAASYRGQRTASVRRVFGKAGMQASDAGLKRSAEILMEITGTTKICGLIGNPVAHTLSPLIQNTLAEDLGQNLVYVPLPVAEDPGAAVRG